MRTVHSLAYAICRDGGTTRVLDERDVRGVLDDLVSVARVPNTDPYQPWLEALAEVRLELRSPEEVEAERDDVPGFAETFPRYREELARRGAVDFDEQLTRAIELLCTDPDLRAAWRTRCTHLLVDELQDVTPAFVLLLRLLAWPDLQMLGVGDDDQVIYGHAGADPAFLLGYDLLVPGAADLRLATNYRCPPDVVAAADTLLGHNRRRAAKQIHAAPGRDDHGPVGPAGGCHRRGRRRPARGRGASGRRGGRDRRRGPGPGQRGPAAVPGHPPRGRHRDHRTAEPRRAAPHRHPQPPWPTCASRRTRPGSAATTCSRR